MGMLLFLLFAATVFAGADACDMVLTSGDITAGRGMWLSCEVYGSNFVSGAGDLNGDGFDDFVISAPNENAKRGAVYVVFGRSAEAWKKGASFYFGASAETPDPESWIRISGVVKDEQLGKFSIAPGDFNGDGLGDIVINALSIGKAFCVFGHSGPWSSFNTSQIENGTGLGFAVSVGSLLETHTGNAGDMNGDGIEDLFVAATGSSSGIVYIIFGTSGMTRTTFAVNTIDGSNGFSVYDNTQYIGVGFAAVSSGDINGDGLADLIIGSSTANGGAGRVYIVFARNVTTSSQQWPGSSFDINSYLDGEKGFSVFGPTKSTNLGQAATCAGDINGDGFKDIFIGSENAGAWVVLGHSDPWGYSLNASQLDGTNGFRFSDVSGEQWGHSGGAAGDVNGDGFDDIIISGWAAQNSLASQTGEAAIILGHSGTWPITLDRNEVKGPVGFLVDGYSDGGQFGWISTGVGDVNGDGLADFAASAETGMVTLVFGSEDHCTVCSNTTEECLVCDDGFVLNGTICKQDTAFSSAVQSSNSNAFVVVIETGGGGGSAIEVAEEVAQLLGVDVGQISVVEITPGTFEVTVINEEVAQQLVTLIEQCMENAESEQQ